MCVWSPKHPQKTFHETQTETHTHTQRERSMSGLVASNRVYHITFDIKYMHILMYFYLCVFHSRTRGILLHIHASLRGFFLLSLLPIPPIPLFTTTTTTHTHTHTRTYLVSASVPLAVAEVVIALCKFIIPLVPAAAVVLPSTLLA